MMIRSEQMSVFESAAEEKFERRLAAHLLENYGAAIVRLPDSESAVGELPEEVLLSLVKNSIERARRYELTFESSISAFSAIRFEVSPNFDKHRLSQVLLKDETVEPDARLDELLEVLTEKNWETIRGEYDVNAWQSEPEEEMTEAENSQETKNADEAKNIEFADTVINVEDAEKSKKPDASPVPDFNLTQMNAETEKPKVPAEVKRVDLEATMMSFDPGKSKKSGDDKDFDFLDTIVNIDVTKE